jgi:hypothetical protein
MAGRRPFSFEMLAHESSWRARAAHFVAPPGGDRGALVLQDYILAPEPLRPPELSSPSGLAAA